MSKGDLISNYSQSPNAVRPQSVTFHELAQRIYYTIRLTYPSFVPTWSIEMRVHDLFVLCPPDLAHEGARWLLPGPMQRLAKELGAEVGAQVLKGQGS